MAKQEQYDNQFTDNVTHDSSRDAQLNDNISQTNDDSRFDSTGSDYYDDESDEDKGGDDGTLAIDNKEMSDVKQLFSFEASYLDNNEEAIFSIADRQKLRERKLALMKKNLDG